MSKAGGCGRGIRVFVENTAIGGRSGFHLARLFRELGGEERVGGSLRRELESLKQVVRRSRRIGVAIDSSQCAPCASLEGGVGHAGIESSGGEQLGPRFGKLILTRKEQAEGVVCLKRTGVGSDGALVESGSIVKTVLGIGNIARVKQGTCVSGMGSQVDVEFGFSSFPVGCGDRRFG